MGYQEKPQTHPVIGRYDASHTPVHLCVLSFSASEAEDS